MMKCFFLILSFCLCAVCGRAYGEQDPDNHSKLTGIKAVPATHLTTGNIAYWHCEGCGKYYADALAAQEITLADTVLEKLPGHTADGSGWHRDKNGHWQLCACGEHLDAAAHTFAWVTDKPATAAEAGSRHEQCTVCGYRKAAESIHLGQDRIRPGGWRDEYRKNSPRHRRQQPARSVDRPVGGVRAGYCSVAGASPP